MIPTVIVNNLTVIHRMSDGKAIATPDVCLTPSPPVPVPYVNVAYSSTLAQEAKTVFADGQGIALKQSCFQSSIGDEPGTAGGEISGVNMGKAIFINYSSDVFAEGQNVPRLSDQMLQNGNASNAGPDPELQGNQSVIDKELEAILCKIFCWCNKKNNEGSKFIRVVQVA